MGRPQQGTPAADVLESLRQMRGNDVQWQEGRAFSLAYFAGHELHDLADEAHRLYSGTNGLNTAAFPSLQRLQSDIVGTVIRWFHGDDQAAGFVTSGGTESLLLTIKAARERGRAERGVTRPNVVLPASAHAALEKGCHYFGVESRRVPVRNDWTADPDAMSAACDDDTVLLVASAPQYPQGVIDPVERIAALAAERGVNCHVDACMGGVTLPSLERLGETVPLWDFRVEGVTSISVDLHKYGYSTKGCGVLVHRNRRLRSYQTFVTENWLGGLYGSSGILGTKGGGPWAAAWALLQHLGDDGYDRLTASARNTAKRLAAGIRATPGLILRAEPASTLLCIGAAEPEALDVNAVADLLWQRGWYVDRQGPPSSLHLTVNAVHEPLVEEFLGDLRECVDDAQRRQAEGTAGAYGTVE
jgi:glutamate/tyrosine decarboxylase-like PLP-dependent enzyme